MWFHWCCQPESPTIRDHWSSGLYSIRGPCAIMYLRLTNTQWSTIHIWVYPYHMFVMETSSLKSYSSCLALTQSDISKRKAAQLGDLPKLGPSDPPHIELGPFGCVCQVTFLPFRNFNLMARTLAWMLTALTKSSSLALTLTSEEEGWGRSCPTHHRLIVGWRQVVDSILCLFEIDCITRLLHSLVWGRVQYSTIYILFLIRVLRMRRGTV